MGSAPRPDDGDGGAGGTHQKALALLTAEGGGSFAASLWHAHSAEHICHTLPSNPERTVALRKLLESKDCAVRAKLYKENTF